ncbi:MAG: T9SS type A sorting domain-containing protein [Bacteroidia bacterium]
MFLASGSFAQVYWDGSTDANWNTASNWVGGVVPNGVVAAIDPSVQAYPNAPIISVNSTFSPTKIDVLNGGNLTIQADLTTTDKITVDGSTSILTMTAGTVNIAIAAAKNLDIKNRANFVFSGGTITAGKDVNIDKGATVTMSGTAFLTVNAKMKIKDVSGGVSSLFDMNGGTVVVTSDLELDGKSNGTTPTLDVSSGTFTVNGQTLWKGDVTDFPHLVVSGGTVTLIGNASNGAGNVDIDISATGALVFQGNLNMTVATDRFDQSGTSTITFQNAKNWTNAGIFTATGGTVINDGNTALLGAGTYTFFNLTINGTKTMNQSAPTNITVNGDWTNTSGTYTHNSKKVIFNGSIAQNITGTSATTFFDLEINNTSATGVTLSQPVTVNNILTLTDGTIFSDATNILTLIDNATVSPAAGGASISYVDGPVKKIGNDAFTFPLGDLTDSRWAPLGISAPTTATTEYTAEYFSSAYSDLSVDVTLTDVSGNEYWTLDQAVNNDDVFVTLYWKHAGNSGINDCPDLEIAHFTGADWTKEAATTVGGSTCDGGTGTGSITTDAVVTTYSPFAFGSTSGGVNPLPIELISFEAHILNAITELKWITATETNNDFFTIEKTKNGIDFEFVGIVDGAGNSTQINNYSAIDGNPYLGVSYYRLKQTDFDGKFEYSDLVAVDNSTGKDFNIDIFPNPATKENINVSITGTSDDEVLIIVSDLLGQELYSKIFVLNNDGKTIIGLDKLENLAPGMYNVLASSSDKLYNRKIVIR